MRLRIDIRIHAQRHWRTLAQFTGHGVQTVELWNRFDIEALHAGRKRIAHFRDALADAREDRVLRAATRRQYAREFATGHDIETRAESREHIEHGKIAVRLDRDMDLRAPARARVCVGVPRIGQRRARIDVKWGAELFGERDGRYAFDVQRAVDVGKCGTSHARVLLGLGNGRGGPRGSSPIVAGRGFEAVIRRQCQRRTRGIRYRR
jgi:hypothetical protein